MKNFSVVASAICLSYSGFGFTTHFCASAKCETSWEKRMARRRKKRERMLWCLRKSEADYNNQCALLAHQNIAARYKFTVIRELERLSESRRVVSDSCKS